MAKLHIHCFTIYLEEVGKSVEPEVLPGAVDVAVGRGIDGTSSWHSQTTMNRPLLPSIIHQGNPGETEVSPWITDAPVV